MRDTALAPAQSRFTTRDGESLALYEWPLPDLQLHGGAAVPRALVLLVHGLGEHAMRHAQVALQLRQWGFAVRAYDQRGHGHSGGTRGVLPTDDALLHDLADVVDDTRRRGWHGLNGVGGVSGLSNLSDEAARRTSTVQAPPRSTPPSIPLILLGHSLGGLVASRFVALGMRPVDGLILSSPALDPGLSWLQKRLLALLPRVAPNLCVGNGLNPQHLSHDPAVVARYRADPLVHDRISGRLARFVAQAGPATVDAAARWTTPTLLLYAGADRLVDPAGSDAFAQAAASAGKAAQAAVTRHRFDGLHHEVFNAPDAGPVLAALQAWLDARFK